MKHLGVVCLGMLSLSAAARASVMVTLDPAVFAASTYNDVLVPLPDVTSLSGLGLQSISSPLTAGPLSFSSADLAEDRGFAAPLSIFSYSVPLTINVVGGYTALEFTVRLGDFGSYPLGVVVDGISATTIRTPQYPNIALLTVGITDTVPFTSVVLQINQSPTAAYLYNFAVGNTFSAASISIPEPASVVLLGIGAFSTMVAARRRGRTPS